jgi:hypothetical protein
MSKLALRLGDSSLCILKKCVLMNCDFFDLHPDLYDNPSYDMESQVEVEDCQTFLNFLQTQDESLIIAGNWRSLLALAVEFGASRLIEVCTAVGEAEACAKLTDRVLRLEDSVLQQVGICEMIERDCGRVQGEFLSAHLHGISGEIVKMRDEIEARFSLLSATWESSQVAIEESIVSLRSEVEEVKLRTEVDLDAVWRSIRVLSETVETDHLKQLKKTEYPLKADESLDGIISYLTQRHGGNVHEMGTVAITSKSVLDDNSKAGPQNVADLASGLRFCSKDEPDQWVCWDFRERRVRTTHYTIWSLVLKSWVVEGSPDGENWTEIDRQADRPAFNCMGTASFVVSDPAEFRFIRLIQTGKSRVGSDDLLLRAVEFFGILAE